MSRKSKNLRNHDSDIMTVDGTMSEKVQLVANSIYQEFERMINLFGSDVLECLMPLIVGVLENLDELYKTKQNDDLEIEIVREDNETLTNQYEKEKALRKQAEERIFDAEFMYEEEKKSLLERSQDIESMLRISELKLRSANDMINRLEKKEMELKAENQKIYERYTDVFKSHGDLLQRLKRYNFVTSSPPSPINHSVKGYKSQNRLVDDSLEMGANKENVSSKIVTKETVNVEEYQPCASVDLKRSNYKEETVADIFEDDQWMTDAISDSLLMPPFRCNVAPSTDFNGNVQDHKSAPFSNTLNIEYEMGTTDNSIEYNNADSDTDITDDEFGIGREIESLIKENQDLVDTKNALNIVKDDLINRVDNLTSENDMLREEIHQHINKLADLAAKVTYLEQELKKYKDEMRKLNESTSNNSRTDGNIEQKSFSRSEMAVLLQERNHFKEKLLELQDALVYTEMMRVKKQFPDSNTPLKPTKTSNSSVWNFFKNVSKTEGEDVPEAVEEKSKILKNRFRLENNRSQLYSWSIPRALIESSLPKRIPIPIKIQRIFEPKDTIICSTLGYEEFQDSRSATYLWCLIQSSNKHYSLVNVGLSAKQPELIYKYSTSLQFPSAPFNICEVPALIYVIKELATIRSLVEDADTHTSNGESSDKGVLDDGTKMTKIFHTKVNIKQKSKSTIGNKTLWFGCEKNQVVIFVLFDNNKLEGRMATANLPSEIDFIKYHIGRVFVMTKNGSVCIFDLNKEVSQWDLHQCLTMDVTNGLPIAASCCDKECLQLWLASSTNCFILSLTHLSIQKSWTVTEDSPSQDQCIAVEAMAKIETLSLMMLAVSRIGSLIGYDVKTLQMMMSIDLRPCVFDLIEPVAGMTKTTLSLYHLVDDSNRLWMATDCGMILVITIECLRSHVNHRKSKISLNSDEVLISSHAFAQCVKNICVFSYCPSSAAIGDVPGPEHVNRPKTAMDHGNPHNSILLSAIGSCYINLNNTMADTLNLSNQALLWKI